MCTYGLLGCRVKPRRLRGRRGFTRQPERAQTCIFERPGASNTTKIPQEDLPKREERIKFPAGERKKSAEFGPPNPSGPHSLRPPKILLPPLRAPTKNKKLAKCGLAIFGQQKLAKFGQIRMAKSGLAKFGRDPPFGAPPFGAHFSRIGACTLPGLHPSGPAPFRAPPLGVPPFGAQKGACSSMFCLFLKKQENTETVKLAKVGLAKVGHPNLSQSRSNKDGQSRFGQSRSQPSCPRQES